MPVIVNISIQDALSRNQYVLCATDPFVGITLNCVVDLKSFWFEKSSLLTISASAINVTVHVASVHVHVPPPLTIPDPFGLLVGPLPFVPVFAGTVFTVPITAIVPKLSTVWPISGVGRGVVELNWNSSCLVFGKASESSMFTFSTYNTSHSVVITFTPKSNVMQQLAVVSLGDVQFIASSFATKLSLGYR